MDTNVQGQPSMAARVVDRHCAGDRLARRAESGEDAIAEQLAIDGGAAVGRDRAAQRFVQRARLLAERGVAQPLRQRRRVRNVREQDDRHASWPRHHFFFDDGPAITQELGYRLKEPLGAFQPRVRRAAVYNCEPGSGYLCSQIGA